MAGSCNEVVAALAQFQEGEAALCLARDDLFVEVARGASES